MSNEEKELSKLERELVLKFLMDKKTPVTINYEKKVSATETQLKKNKAEISDDEKVSASDVFPLVLNPEQMEIIKQGIILIKNSERQISPFFGKKVRVQFYFNRLPIYFISEIKSYSGGYALVIPEILKRAKEYSSKNNFDIEGIISYKVHNDQLINLYCYPLDGFSLLSEMTFADIPVNLQQSSKAYLEKFVNEAKSGLSSPIGKGRHLIPVAKYLSQPVNLEVLNDMENNQNLNIIYFDDERLVLASRSNNNSIELENDYDFEFSFVLVPNTRLKRKIRLSFTVENIYNSDTNSSVCYICKYNRVENEDKRFLKEKNKF